MQGPSVAIDGHRAPQTVKIAAAPRVERNHIQRVALPDGINLLQAEKVMVFAASADGVDIIGARDIDGFVIKADTLHAVDQVDESRLFHTGHFGAKHMLQLAIGRHEQHL